MPGVKHSEAKLERDFRGHGVFRETASPRRPATALSGAKAAEIKGQNIFADGEVNRRTAVAVVKPDPFASQVRF